MISSGTNLEDSSPFWKLLLPENRILMDSFGYPRNGISGKVWQALMEIPPGETVSYAQLSHSLGHSKAARAVARACASNRLAVLVPCHRMIRGSGDLAGYKRGIERKQKLLKQEARDQ